MFHTEQENEQSKGVIEQLANMMKDYEEIAGQNLHRLRERIPPYEVWRFFIDGMLQEHGRGLSSSPYFIQAEQKGVLDLTIKEYIEREEGIKIETSEDWVTSDFWVFLKGKRWNVIEQERKNLTLRDLLNLDKAWMPFEIDESGYLAALYQAFPTLFAMDSPFDSNFIKRLHQFAVTNVKHTNYEDDDENKIGEFRMTDTGSFPLFTASASPEGLLEILMRAHPQISLVITFFDPAGKESIGTLKINQDSVKAIRYLVEDREREKKGDRSVQHFGSPLAKYCEPHEMGSKDFIEKLQKDENIYGVLKLFAQTNDTQKDIAHTLWSVLQHPNKHLFKVSLQSIQESDPQQELENEMANLLENYNKSIQSAKTPLDTLLAIIKYAQFCEQLHPFIDGNCRTFGMLMLNHLLMRNGFPPAILENPNRLDAFSEKQLLVEVINGMQNTLKLIKEKKLFNVDTKEIMAYLAANNRVDTVKDYFDKVVQIEQHAREDKRQALGKH